MWYCAVLVIRNRDGLHGFPQHNNGTLGLGPILVNQLQWWCTPSEDYGYGIFHLEHVDPATGSYRLVSLEYIPMPFGGLISGNCILRESHLAT